MKLRRGVYVDLGTPVVSGNNQGMSNLCVLTCVYSVLGHFCSVTEELSPIRSYRKCTDSKSLFTVSEVDLSRVHLPGLQVAATWGGVSRYFHMTGNGQNIGHELVAGTVPGPF